MPLHYTGIQLTVDGNPIVGSWEIVSRTQNGLETTRSITLTPNDPEETARVLNELWKTKNKKD